jgi:dienelactone hydrolase
LQPTPVLQNMRSTSPGAEPDFTPLANVWFRIAVLCVSLALSLPERAGAQASVSQPETPLLKVDPPVGLVDVPVHMLVSGLSPNQLVRITATSRTATDRALLSWAVFRADESGNIDIGTAKPMDGTYTNADPMGLFWSMAPQPVPVEIWRHMDLPPFRPPEPWTILLEVAPEKGGSALATLKVVRLYAAEGVRSLDVRDHGIAGKLVLPARGSSNRNPGIILLGGSEGGLDAAGAALLASHGYAVLALAYFGLDTLPSELAGIPVEYSIGALEWLRARPEVDPDRIAIIGRSRGSELALLTAVYRPDVKAIVAIGPSCVAWGGLPKSPNSGPVAAWTYQGKPLPFLSANRAPPELVQEFYAKGPLQSRLYDFLFSDREAVEHATIPIELIHGQVLLISGKEDRVWGSPIMAQRIMDRAHRFDRAGSFLSVSYDSAGHNIREPYRPTPATWRLGGTMDGHAWAEQDSWQKILGFLERNLKLR